MTGIRQSKQPIPQSVQQEITSFVKKLKQKGYRKRTLQPYFRYVLAFGRWLDCKKISLHQANESTIEKYIRTCLNSYSDSYQRWAMHAIKMLLAHVHDGDMQSENNVAAMTANEQLLLSYGQYLDAMKGLVINSRKQYLFYASRFLCYQNAGGDVDWSQLTAERIVDYVAHEMGPRTGFGPHRVATAIRSFLRYLVGQGLLRSGIENSIPVMRVYSQASLPKHFSKKEVERLLAACIDGTKLGKRNRAILLLLARLGLRANEIIRIKLEDVDWINSYIVIRASKPRGERKLPMTKEIGDCLSEYLLYARPSSKYREIFLSHVAPVAPLQYSTVVSHIVGKLVEKAGIEKNGRCGAHRLRHTAATRLVNDGASFKEVADFLGHQWLQTTAIYAKLNLDALSAIALPWPGGEQ